MDGALEFGVERIEIPSRFGLVKFHLIRRAEEQGIFMKIEK